MNTNVTSPNLRLSRTTARTNTSSSRAGIERYLREARKTKADPVAQRYVDAVVAEGKRLVALLVASDTKLETLEADVEKSAVAVMSSRQAVSVARAVDAAGTFDAVEAIRMRDEVCILAARNRKLENDHQRLLGSHGAASAVNGEGSRFLQRVTTAKSHTTSIAKSHAGPFGCSVREVSTFGEAVTDEIEIGMWAIEEPAEVANVVPVEREGKLTRTAEELQMLFATRLRVAVETLDRKARQ